MSLLSKLFINPGANDRENAGSAYRRQVKYLQAVWNDDTYGLERLLRLFLCLVQFIYPILLIRQVFGRWGATSRKLAVEAYNVFKLIFPLLILSCGWYKIPFILVLVVYLLSETIFHILNLIFLSDVHLAAVSYHRSILLLFLHYAEVVLDFAAIYIGFDLLSEPLNPVSAVYFSTVANTTVGFGDICAKGAVGQLVVISQLALCVVFVILFINYFSSRVNDEDEE
ncbi:MAG: ion channel [Candidatus Omnitrophica bacterium]|nr:ion channel [Candidatus Omnitrophota bacterium]MDD5654249.1 ion channel [Candidatus Omnitrophota bacterium]